jgi:hypothetical protein
MNSKKQIKTHDKGGFNFAATGIVALVALGALGGGVQVLLKMSNQNNPTINVQGASAKSGDANITIATTSPENGSQSQKDEAQLQPSEATPNPASTRSENLKTANPATTQIDLKSGGQWAFKFPLYRIQGKDCSLIGSGSVPLLQRQDGALSYSGTHNFYGSAYIQGTITTSGRMDASLSTLDRNVVTTFEGKKISSENGEIVITGDATTLNCPASKFELRKQG